MDIEIVAPPPRIPELKESQVEVLHDMCGDLNAFVLLVPEEKKDGEEYENSMEVLRDTEQMFILGLIADVSIHNAEILAQQFKRNGRIYRIFEITPVGRMMFSDTEKRSVN